MTAPTDRPASRLSLPALLTGLALLGLGLRIAAAQGDYWLDEAWSAVFARDAVTPGRIFFAINHDNNHFLNTLWLQLVGWSAPPTLGRAPSILCGTITIVIAGLIGARRGIAVAGTTAALFAVSPILVTYGSEARGYAPMLLALLIAIWIVDRQLFGTPLRQAAQWLGLATLLGMLCHVSMLFGIAALTGWVLTEQARRTAFPAALLATFRLMGRAIAAIAAVLLLVVIAAMASPDGWRMGSLTPFSHPAFFDALAFMLAFTIGWPIPSFWLVPLLFVPLFLRRHPAMRDHGPFFLLAILGLPLLVAIVQPDNSAFPRYYLLSAVALLLLIPEMLTRRSSPALAALGTMLFCSVAIDMVIIANRRGDTGAAIDAMAEILPQGATVLLDNARDGAVIEAAAAPRGYFVTAIDRCTNARFFYAEYEHGAALPLAALRCGMAFRPIAGGDVYGLSGMTWRLYEHDQ